MPSAPSSPVSLNIDLGELPGEPERLYSLATVVNVACGGHAGDDATIERACGLVKENGASLAAHPSYPDREGFGRRSISMPPEALALAIRTQIEALLRFARPMGLVIEAIKPHGALYHDAAKHDDIARSLLWGIDLALGDTSNRPALVGPPGSALENLAKARGQTYLREGFADRAYRPDGTLVPRSQEGALVQDPQKAAAQALRLAKSGAFDTLCVHGDTPGALEIANAVRSALESASLLLS